MFCKNARDGTHLKHLTEIDLSANMILPNQGRKEAIFLEEPKLREFNEIHLTKSELKLLNIFRKKEILNHSEAVNLCEKLKAPPALFNLEMNGFIITNRENDKHKITYRAIKYLDFYNRVNYNSIHSIKIARIALIISFLDIAISLLAMYLSLK